MLHRTIVQAAQAVRTGRIPWRICEEAMPPTRTHFQVRTVGGFFWPLETWKVQTTQSGVKTMKQVIASLRGGNWKALLACFLYFDTGFTAWVMFGPLAPYVSRQLSLSPTQ